MLIPNLCLLRPVEMYGCVEASTSGFTRIADARLHIPADGQRIDQGKLRFRLAVEAVDAALERIVDLIGGLADARENHSGRIPASLDHTEQFAARDDVETRAGFGQQASGWRDSNLL